MFDLQGDKKQLVNICIQSKSVQTIWHGYLDVGILHLSLILALAYNVKRKLLKPFKIMLSVWWGWLPMTSLISCIVITNFTWQAITYFDVTISEQNMKHRNLVLIPQYMQKNSQVRWKTSQQMIQYFCLLYSMSFQNIAGKGSPQLLALCWFK